MQRKSTGEMSNNQLYKFPSPRENLEFVLRQWGITIEEERILYGYYGVHFSYPYQGKEKYQNDTKDTFVVGCNDINTLLRRFSGKIYGDNLQQLKTKLGLVMDEIFSKLVLSFRNENSADKECTSLGYQSS
ncbi:hypothetical protein LOD99_9174 [Oopsacas minuta]|uniref:Uncharacterized protein n=1 Tax=Oopsacas minuta TaxID=111878 RepID=A0AAV7JDH5_9METZ|nr:hypothetical protein LOD99_9174 [Oopsacas minuta]